ncbi:bifunctional phosphoribosyl-AMP cyclohydrolase/phosphoribosyl-ATP diphosphatase HisIE [Myroides indicus]|uniref:Histidine biosynthesis bifunctional protein HisIE n=1 Tax=Myroides indicus TaxID=1323422 RepID=A0A4R7ETQ0_9FLAO|nr:bifunctional phosphoribosyl-AMP cyclohydrolase/phosphoribosyl-ATP diphosphatase HisIE [Myroides indicus]TDS56919.1 phosphoribosyl-ATP pyrophosphatase /phosphoribosyl-AMP cyclohydrolase [Myroides indicus]
MRTEQINFKKNNGLIPVIIQDYKSLEVLMLGYMNKTALDKTMLEQKVTFYSRTRKCLWTKGEVSGNYLKVVDITPDCDSDCLLILAKTNGPTCHLGTTSCFKTFIPNSFLYTLERIIDNRIDSQNSSSYTFDLFEKGINKIAQKVGEEAIELIIESKDNRLDLFKNEAADLLYHFIILLKAKGISLTEIEQTLKQRNSQSL